MSLHAAAFALANALFDKGPSCGDGSLRTLHAQGLADVKTAVEAFTNDPKGSVFTFSDTTAAWKEFGGRLKTLVENPWALDQRQLSACGTAAFWHIWLKRDPASAAQCAMDLFQHGHGKIGALDLVPSQDLLKENYYALVAQYDPKLAILPDLTDWILLSSLRDATRGFGRFYGLPMDKIVRDDAPAAGGVLDEITGMVDPSELRGWLEATGLYSSVSNHTILPATRSLDDAQLLHPDDTRDVVLLMSTQMLKVNLAKRDCDCGQVNEGEILGNLVDSVSPNHYVVLDTPIDVSKDQKTVRLCFWCWGDLMTKEHLLSDKNIECDCMPYEVDVDSFRNNYYGAVIAVRK